MKKLRLKLEALQVESFETDENTGPRGTVHGHDLSLGPIDCFTQSGRDAYCIAVCEPNSAPGC